MTLFAPLRKCALLFVNSFSIPALPKRIFVELASFDCRPPAHALFLQKFDYAVGRSANYSDPNDLAFSMTSGVCKILSLALLRIAITSSGGARRYREYVPGA
jgi:hypothetical protein